MKNKITSDSPPPAQVCSRKLVFVCGKGGVGKTAVSQSLALALSRRGQRTLWVAFEQAGRPANELISRGKNLWHLNAEAMTAFEEYAAIQIEKLGLSRLTKIFVQNKLIRYLAQAAPGLHELILLGKVWHERERYDQVVVDMPSTGYGMAMFQSTANFARLFGKSPLAKDAEAMLTTFRDPQTTGFWIVGLPEEMPLREALDLDGLLRELFPKNPAAFVVNRRFPQGGKASKEKLGPPSDWPSPFAESVADYVKKRATLERYNLELWTQRGFPFAELPYAADPDLSPDLSKEIERILSS